jgi:hypothetical protein
MYEHMFSVWLSPVYATKQSMRQNMSVGYIGELEF